MLSTATKKIPFTSWFPFPRAKRKPIRVSGLKKAASSTTHTSLSNSPNNSQKATPVRHPFNKDTKRVIRLRSGYTCANPNCQRFLYGCYEPNGQVAHIRACSANGPRASPKHEQAGGQIRHESNGLWLCAPCHKEIDEHPKSYSVTLLRSWKRRHEVRVARFLADVLEHQQEQTNKKHQFLKKRIQNQQVILREQQEELKQLRRQVAEYEKEKSIYLHRLVTFGG